jgi:hypothetical protein
MASSTAWGFWSPTGSDLLKQLWRNLKHMADSVQAGVERFVGLIKIYPVTIESQGPTGARSYIDENGQMQFEKVSRLQVNGAFDRTQHVAWDVEWAIHNIRSNSGLGFKILLDGQTYGSTGAYAWQQRVEKGTSVERLASITKEDGRPNVDNGSDHLPLSVPPGSDHVHTASGRIHITRAADDSSTNLFVDSSTNLLYEITDITVKGAYNSTGRDFDGFQIELVGAPNDTFDGHINITGYN